jgi:ribose transport system permease protein
MMKKELGLGVLLVVISAITGAINPAFLSLVNLLNMANLIGLFGIFALGEGLVIITGGIDLSLGSMFALLGVIFVDLLTTYQIHWPVALLLVLLGGLALGAIQGFLVTRLKMQPFIVTLCGLLIYRGAARYYTSDSTRGFGYGDEAGTLSNIASGNVAGIPNTFILLIILALILGVLLHRSVYGRWLYAVGKNEEAARFSGISTNIVIATAYIISGGLAGVSTVFYTNSVSPSSFGNFYELYAIAAAVLGGCSLRGGEGSILGIVLGTALLQVLQNLVNILGIPNSLNFAVMGTVILFGVLADQQLQARRRRKIALAGLARAAPRSTLAQGKQNASPHGAAALPARTGDQV